MRILTNVYRMEHLADDIRERVFGKVRFLIGSFDAFEYDLAYTLARKRNPKAVNVAFLAQAIAAEINAHRETTGYRPEVGPSLFND